MANELMTKEEIQNVLGELAIRETSVSKAVGVIQSQVERHEKTLMSIKEEQDAHYQEFIDYKEVQKDREYIEPADTQELREAVHNRIGDLLKWASVSEKDFGRLFGAFARKCWADCKKYANVIGTSGVYTKRKDFQNAKEYIGTWTPHGYGVKGYIDHLDTSK